VDRETPDGAARIEFVDTDMVCRLRKSLKLC
jgi:hypothetical protein